MSNFLEKMRKRKSKCAGQEDRSTSIDKLKEDMEILSKAQETENKVSPLNAFVLFYVGDSSFCSKVMVCFCVDHFHSLIKCFQIAALLSRKEECAAKLLEAKNSLRSLESESVEFEKSHADMVTNLSEAKRLERCISGWGLGELEKLKQQVEEDQREVNATENGLDRDQLEKELDKLESKITSKRGEIQALAAEIKDRKDLTERLLNAFYE